MDVSPELIDAVMREIRDKLEVNVRMECDDSGYNTYLTVEVSLRMDGEEFQCHSQTERVSAR